MSSNGSDTMLNPTGGDENIELRDGGGAGYTFAGAGIDGEIVAKPVNPLLQVHALLRGRYWIAIILAIIGAVAGGAIGYKLQRPIYTSTGVIRIKPNKDRILYQNDQNGIMPMFDAYMGSQVALIRTRQIIDLAMSQDDWKQLNRPLTPEKIQDFIDSIEALNPRGSELVLVSFSDEEADAARRGAKCVIDAYEQKYGERDFGNVRKTLEILEARQLEEQGKLTQSTAAIRRLADKLPIGSMQELYDSILRQTQELKARLEQAKVAVILAGDGSNAAAPAATRPAFKPLSEEALAMRVPELSRLVTDKRALERQIAVDIARRGEKHQSVIEAQAQLKALNDQIGVLAKTYNDLMKEGEQVAPAVPLGKSREQLVAERDNLEKLYNTSKEETDILGSRVVQIEQFRVDAEWQKAMLDATNKRIDELQTEMRMAGRFTVESRGDTPLAPSKDKRIAFAGAGAVGLAGVGVGLVLIFGLLDRRIRHISDVKTTGQANRILGVLPMLPNEESDPEQAMVAAHSVHQIRMLLQGHLQSRKNSVIAITSASPAAGKTSLTTALGLSFAASGARTLLIDCDIVGGGLSAKMKRVSRRRTGCVLRRLGLITTAQLVSAVRESRNRGERIGETLIRQGLVTPADVDHALAVQQDSPVGLREALMGDPTSECITGGGTPGLFVMPLGSAQRQHVAQMSVPAMQKLISQVRGWFDVVLIDTGPILGSLEASVAAMVADEVILAVAKGEQRPLIDRAVQHLNSVGGRIAGIVLNRANADDILASEFSSSSSRRSSGESEEQLLAKAKIRAADHQCLQLGPIGRAVVESSDVESLPAVPLSLRGEFQE